MGDSHRKIVDRLSSLVNGHKEQRRVQRETESDEDIDECLSRLFPNASSRGNRRPGVSSRAGLNGVKKMMRISHEVGGTNFTV